ncbi:MAG: hypothetical protein HY716_07975 [Planctomycetes bacterium]|nr:hypothetical protein [Planctomycetota bacterium]
MLHRIEDATTSDPTVCTPSIALPSHDPARQPLMGGCQAILDRSQRDAHDVGHILELFPSTLPRSNTSRSSAGKLRIMRCRISASSRRTVCSDGGLAASAGASPASGNGFFFSSASRAAFSAIVYSQSASRRARSHAGSAGMHEPCLFNPDTRTGEMGEKGKKNQRGRGGQGFSNEPPKRKSAN